MREPGFDGRQPILIGWLAAGIERLRHFDSRMTSDRPITFKSRGHNLTARSTTLFFPLAAMALLGSTSAIAQTLVLDSQTGHYQDLSYKVLSSKGLSGQARAKLFGGETVHYRELSDNQRIVKQAELQELLRRMDVAAMMLTGKQERNLGGRVELAIRS